MTPLKPLENLRVRGVAITEYPLNEKCAHPECAEKATDPHHCFPRSQIMNDYWFVEITQDEEGDSTVVIPHVTGLCNFHHGIVEMHLAWIRLEDGVFVWYDRVADAEKLHELGMKRDERAWELLGALNPQPGQVEGKPKRKKKTGEARRQRRTISLRVPKDTEDGGGLWDELFAELKEACVEDDLFESVEKAAEYETIMAVGRDWLDRRPTWKVV